jgi:hypothetical protein
MVCAQHSPTRSGQSESCRRILCRPRKTEPRGALNARGPELSEYNLRETSGGWGPSRNKLNGRGVGGWGPFGRTNSTISAPFHSIVRLYMCVAPLLPTLNGRRHVKSGVGQKQIDLETARVRGVPAIPRRSPRTPPPPGPHRYGTYSRLERRRKGVGNKTG